MADDYYQILGVEPGADFELIKQQYRTLVREHHPDVAADKDAAHARMQDILEAWSILSDPSERARYDSRRQGAAAPDAGPVRRPAGPVGEEARRARLSRNAQNVGAGPGHRASARTQQVTQVFEAAQLYYFQHDAAQAIAICSRIIKRDRHNAEAPALLGDIYSEQGRPDLALLMYERAMRNQPGNNLYRHKYETLRRSRDGHSSESKNGTSAAAASVPSADGKARGVASSSGRPAPPRTDSPVRAGGEGTAAGCTGILFLPLLCLLLTVAWLTF